MLLSWIKPERLACRSPPLSFNCPSFQPASLACAPFARYITAALMTLQGCAVASLLERFRFLSLWGVSLTYVQYLFP